MTETFKGFVPSPSNTPAWPINPDTGVTYTFDELQDKLQAQIEGLSQRGALELVSVAGTANAVTGSTIFATTNVPGLTALTGGMLFWFKPVLANDGDVTMQIDGMAVPVDVLANDGTATAAGYFQVGSTYLLKYDSTLGALVNTDVGSSVLAGNRAPDDVFECQRAAGTSDGNTLAATAQERALNVAIRNTGGVILDTSTGRFTLPPGNREIAWSAGIYGSGLFISELYDLTNSAIVKTGTTQNSGTTGMPRSEGKHYVELASATQYVIRTKAVSAVTDGLGKASNLGDTEVYTRVEITQIDETNDTFIGTPGGPITLPYEFDTAVTSPPDTSRLNANNTSFASATELYVSQTDGNAADVGAIFDYLQAGTSTKKALAMLVQVSDPTKWILLDIGSLTDIGLFYTFGITKIAGTVDVFDDAAQLLLQLGKVGDAGTTGAMTSIVAPTALAADANDYTVGAAGRQVITVLTDANADRTITGLVKKAAGEVIFIVNIDTTKNIILSNDNASSAAANRFKFSADLTLAPKNSAMLWHDETLNAWRLLGRPNVTDTDELNAAEVSIVAAATTDIGSLTSIFAAIVAGAGTISSFGTQINKTRFVRFATDVTLTHDDDTLDLLVGEDRDVTAGSWGIYRSDASGDWAEVTFNDGTGNTELQSQIDDLAANWERTAVGNTNTTLAATVRTAALNSTFTSPRTWTLPAAADYPVGVPLVITDEVGGIGPTNYLTVIRAGSDTINQGSSITAYQAYSIIWLYSDGISKWTAQISDPGSNSRTPVGDANYTAVPGDRVLALTTALTASRTINLPLANSVPAGWSIKFVDEIGGISTTNQLIISKAGGSSDTINNGPNTALYFPNQEVSFTSDGSSRWTGATLNAARASGVSFPVAGCLAYWITSGTTTELGSIAALSPDSIPGLSLTISDANLNIRDDSDTTKRLKFELSGIATGTIRTVTWPDANITVVGVDTTQTLTNKTLTSPVISGGTINNAVIGGSTPAAATVTTLTATGLADLSGAAAGQIKFPATQNASADANTLDDYEEGTFTPTLAFVTVGTSTWSYATQLGGYTKIGNRVMLAINLIATPTIGTGAGVLRIGGLPFTIDTGITAAGAVAELSVNFTWSAGRTMIAAATASSTTLQLNQQGSAVAAAGLGATNMLTGNAHTITLSFNHRV